MAGSSWSRGARWRRWVARRARRALGAVRAALGGRKASTPPEEDAAYTASLLASVWAAEPPERITVGSQEFVLGVPDTTSPETNPEDHLVVFKSPAMVRRYQELAASIGGQRVVELGVSWGGSTALLYELFQPKMLLAFDLESRPRRALDAFIATRGVQDRIRLHYSVHQSDQVLLLSLVRAAVADEPLDFVVDDASHSYVHSRASFGALFPLLAEGGLFVIEDWAWAHTPGDRWQRDGGYLPGEPALTNLIAEVLVLQGTRPDLVREVRVRRGLAEVVRGEATVESPMDMAALMMNRGNPFRPFI